MKRPPLLFAGVAALLLLAGFCAGRGSRAANDRATKAWLDSTKIRDSTFAALRAKSVQDSARADSLAAIARRPIVVVRTVLQPQLDTATTARDSVVLLVAQRDSLMASAHRWALAFAAVSASRDTERRRADEAERELVRATKLLRKAHRRRCGLGAAGPLTIAGSFRLGVGAGLSCLL
jgi:hypothetical protein